MRRFHAITLGLAIVVAAAGAQAKQPKPRKGKPPAGTTAPSKKVAADPAQEAPPPAAAAAAEPVPAPAPQRALPAPVEPDAHRPAAPAAAPASASGSSASALDGAGDRDRASARIDGPPKPFSVAPLFGYAGNGLRVGAGLRAGYTLPAKVYLGAAFMYHLGTSSEVYGVKASMSAFYPAAEAGYDFHVGRSLVVRPYGGLAAIFATATVEGRGGEISAHDTSVGIYPGCALSYRIADSSFFVGGDARYLIVVDGGGSSLGLFASAGMTF